MILGSLPFTLYVATLRGNRRALIKDQQVQGLLGMLLVTWLVLGTRYWWTTQLHWLEALRHVALNVTSVGHHHRFLRWGTTASGATSR